MPPEDITSWSRRCSPSASHSCSCRIVTSVFDSIQARASASQGIFPRSKSVALPGPGTRPSRLRSNCAACAPTAPAVIATGTMNSTTVSSVVIELASCTRPPRRCVRRRFSGASRPPSSIAQSSGCHRGVTMRHTT
jgi:hypothetical protein